MEQWFSTQKFSASVNSRGAESVWIECLTKHREGCLPDVVVASQQNLHSADASITTASFSQPEMANQADDIDTMLSAAGTFVRDQKTSASSLLGSDVYTEPQVVHEDIAVLSQHSDKPVSNDQSTLATDVNHHKTASDWLASHVVLDNSYSQRKPFRHFAG